MVTDEARSAVAHLLRRAGFSSAPTEVDRLAALGYDVAVDLVCDHDALDVAADAVDAPVFDREGYRAARASGDPAQQQAAQRQSAAERRALVLWWLQRMVAADRPHREKLTFLWHDHFATSMGKVQVAALMHQHWATLHDGGAGRFDDLVIAMAKDPAMLWWLDGMGSSREAPNENFARELLELFTLGHGGHHGAPPYSERDVTEAARALTGWDIDRNTGAAVFDPARHDPAAKTVLGATGPLDLDAVVRVATGHPACAPHVVSRLWSRMARPGDPEDPVVRELARTFATDLDVTALLRRIYLHPEFQAPASRQGLIKTPVELLVGAARTLGVSVDDRAVRTLEGLGQVPFYPPDVSGWPANEAWLSTASARTVLQVATYLADAVPVPELADAPSRSRADAAAHLLGIDRWSAPTHRALQSASGDPRSVLIVALVSPEHLLA